MHSRMCVAGLFTLALLHLALFVHAAAPAAVAPGLCRPLSSEFDFPKQPPAKNNDLAFCKEYRGSTCCDKTHSLSVLRSLSPYFDPTSERVSSTFSDSCRQIVSTIQCAPCHPDVGTGRRVGICPALCDSWFHACADGLFTESEGVLRPCTEASLVCAPLREIVHSGAELCARTPLGLGKPSGSAHEGKIVDDIARMVRSDAGDASADEDSDAEIGCFDGSSTAGRSAYSAADAEAADANSDSSSSEGGARKRYYKTAEEVAELEKKRAARSARDAAQSDPWAELARHPAVKALRLTASRAHSELTRLQRRIVRALPIPRVVQRFLEGTFGLALLALAFQLVVWSVLQRAWAKLFPPTAARRRGAQASGWAPEVHPPPSVFAALSGSSVTSANLSAEQLRQRRAEKLMQKQYAKSAAKTELDDEAASEDDESSSSPAQPTAAAAMDTYTAIIDGEVVQIPK